MGLATDPKLLTWLVNGVALSVCVQALLIAVTGVGDGTRYSGFFNNPNQLGYFVLSAVTLVLIAGRQVRPPAWLFPLFIVSAAMLVLLSLSRAATISMAALCFVAVLTSRHRWLVIGSIALASVGIAAAQRSMNERFLTAIERVVVRAGSFEEKLEVMSEERGYERILRHPWYLVAGAGEGRPSASVRDNSRSIRHLETWHSGYGVVGVALALLAACLVCRGARVSELLLLLPLAIYGLTHNGVRSTLAWLVVAVLYVVVRHTQMLPLSDSAQVGCGQPHGANV